MDVIGGARVLRELIESRAEQHEAARVEGPYPVEDDGRDHSPFVRRVRAHVEAAYGNAKLETLESES